MSSLSDQERADLQQFIASASSLAVVTGTAAQEAGNMPLLQLCLDVQDSLRPVALAHFPHMHALATHLENTMMENMLEED